MINDIKFQGFEHLLQEVQLYPEGLLTVAVVFPGTMLIKVYVNVTTQGSFLHSSQETCMYPNIVSKGQKILSPKSDFSAGIHRSC